MSFICHTKICNFELAATVDEKILRFQVSVEDISLVYVAQST